MFTENVLTYLCNANNVVARNNEVAVMSDHLGQCHASGRLQRNKKERINLERALSRGGCRADVEQAQRADGRDA